MPFVPKSEGRSYSVFPAANTPQPLALNGKLYGKTVAGQVQLFFLSDNGTEYQITPGGAVAYPFELPETATPAPLANTGKLYSKDVAGVSQLFFLADDGAEYQITPNVNQAQAYVVWRPASPSSPGFVQTWAEVEALIALYSGAIIIAIDGAAVIPSTADVECFGRVQFWTYTANNSSLADITVQDGGRLRNLFTLKTCAIHGAPTIRPFIYQDIPGGLLICREGGQLTLDLGATVSAIEFDANFNQVAQFEGATYLNATGNPAVSIVQVNSGNTALHALIALAGTPGPPAYADNMFSGDATTVLLQIYDASGPPVAQPNFLGFALPLPMDYSLGVVYQDTTATPALGAVTVQAAIDVLKRRNVGFGNTASRPAIPADVDTGGMYFDTDLGYPIWSNGAVWVDAAGVAV